MPVPLKMKTINHFFFKFMCLLGFWHSFISQDACLMKLMVIKLATFYKTGTDFKLLFQCQIQVPAVHL